jgi:transposase
MGTADGSARRHRPSSRLGAGRAPCRDVRPAADAAGEQRHAAAGRAATQQSERRPADRHRHRRAWRRNQRYGTLICDLERRRTIALLPDREPATAQAWLSDQPQITTVARDRGGGYGLAVTKALPNALQVADRWHLMENASSAFLEAVRTSMRQIRAAIGTTTINPDLLTAAERIQYEGYLRREKANAVILGLARRGMPIKEIVRRTGHSRGLVRKVLRGQRTDIFRSRESSLDLYLPWLVA